MKIIKQDYWNTYRKLNNDCYQIRKNTNGKWLRRIYKKCFNKNKDIKFIGLISNEDGEMLFDLAKVFNK